MSPLNPTPPGGPAPGPATSGTDSAECPDPRCPGCPKPLQHLRWAVWSRDQGILRPLSLLAGHIASMFHLQVATAAQSTCWGYPVSRPVLPREPNRFVLLHLGNTSGAPLAIDGEGNLREPAMPFRKVVPRGPTSLPGYEFRPIYEDLAAMVRRAHQQTASPEVLRCLDETLDRLWRVTIVQGLRRRPSRRSA